MKRIVGILAVVLILALAFGAYAYAGCQIGLMNPPVTLIYGDYYFAENEYDFQNDDSGWRQGVIYVNDNGMGFSGDFGDISIDDNVIRAAIRQDQSGLKYVDNLKIVWAGESTVDGNDHFNVYVNDNVFAGKFYAEGNVSWLGDEWYNVLTICGPGI